MEPISAVHPGEILGEMIELNDMSAEALAGELHVSTEQLNAILAGNEDISADIALRLSKHLGTAPYYWMVLQNSYDLYMAQRENHDVISKIMSVGADAGLAVETDIENGKDVVESLKARISTLA